MNRIGDPTSLWDVIFIIVAFTAFAYALVKLAAALQESGRSRWLTLLPMIAVFLLLMDKINDDR